MSLSKLFDQSYLDEIPMFGDSSNIGNFIPNDKDLNDQEQNYVFIKKKLIKGLSESLIQILEAKGNLFLNLNLDQKVDLWFQGNISSKGLLFINNILKKIHLIEESANGSVQVLCSTSNST